MAVYRRVGVATAFSPRFLAVLAEAARISRLFESPLHLIHAAAEEPEKLGRLKDALHTLELPSESPIHFERGEPAEAILRVQNQHRIDLLIAGAMERETVHRNFTGDVARTLLREAPCDLLLFVDPREDAQPPAQIFVAIPDFTPLSREAFLRTTAFAEKVGAQELTLLHVQSTFAEAKEKALGNEPRSVEDALDDWTQNRHQSSLNLETHSVRGNTGFTACEFIQASAANLLVLPSHLGHPNHPVFAPVLDWIMQVIPTNLWVIRQVSECVTV
ncbi:MAG: universal stress protein [Verrucomicrobia bacterium]|nr:universal stress protein [Verrucomicrobiota bacterium]